MARLVKAEIHVLKMNFERRFLGRIRELSAKSEEFSKPDYVIAAGSATNLPLLQISKKYGARSICLMKPGLPLAFYDFCIAPEHDFPVPPKGGNVILSKGALNRVVAGGGERAGKLLLIGGPSGVHGYDEKKLIWEIFRIVDGDGWEVADSRRTPETFLPSLLGEIKGLKAFPHADTEDGWLARKLSTVEEVWVTEDSVSMIYEALSGGAKVGVLEMPRLKPGSRVLRGLKTLEAEGYLIGSGDGRPPLLAEADRCAELVLDSAGKEG